MVKHTVYRQAHVLSIGIDTVYHCVCSEIVNAIAITISFFEGIIAGCAVG